MNKEDVEDELRKAEHIEKWSREFCSLISQASKSSNESNKMKQKLKEIKKYPNSFYSSSSNKIDTLENILEYLKK